MSWGREGPPLPLVRGECFLVSATSRGRPSSGMSPPEPGRRAAKRLFILRYLIYHRGKQRMRNSIVYFYRRVDECGLIKAILNFKEFFIPRIFTLIWLTSPALPESEQKCSWLHEDSLLSASCLDTCMSCICYAEVAKERQWIRERHCGISILRHLLVKSTLC